MQIIRADDRVIELSGIPGGGAAVVVPVGVMGVGGLCVGLWWATGAIVPLVAGVVLIAAGVAAGVGAWTARERLVIDLATRRGSFERRTLLGKGTRPLEFALERVRGVSVERGVVRIPGRGAGEGTETWTARLLIDSPRRAIVLAETQGGSERRVREIAERVARAIGASLIDESGDEREVVGAGRIGEAVARRWERTPRFGRAPEGSRVSVSVDSETLSVALEWKTVGGAALPVMGLLAIGVFALVATAMLLEAVGLPVLTALAGGAAGTTSARASAGIIASLGAMAGATWLAMALIVQTWAWSRRRLEVTPEVVRLVAVSPLAALGRAVGARGVRWEVRPEAIVSVRTHEDAIEVRTAERTRRALVHLPAEGEVAWAAGVVRSAVRVVAGEPRT